MGILRGLPVLLLLLTPPAPAPAGQAVATCFLAAPDRPRQPVPVPAADARSDEPGPTAPPALVERTDEKAPETLSEGRASRRHLLARIAGASSLAATARVAVPAALCLARRRGPACAAIPPPPAP